MQAVSCMHQPHAPCKQLRRATQPFCTHRITSESLNRTLQSFSTQSTEGSAHYTVRQAGMQDVNALHVLLETNGLPWTAGALQKELAKDYAIVLLSSLQQQQDTSTISIQNGSVLAGTLIAWQIADEVQILEIIVDASHRRKGVASMLLHQLEAPTKGLSMFLEVKADNAAAIALYTKHGFQPVGRRKGYYADGTDALLMQRPIIP